MEIKNLTEDQREKLSKKFQDERDENYTKFCEYYRATMIERLEEHNNNTIYFDINGIIATKKLYYYDFDNNDIEFPFLNDFEHINIEFFTGLNLSLGFQVLINVKDDNKFKIFEYIDIDKDCKFDDKEFENIIYRLEDNVNYSETEKTNIIKELKKLEPILKTVLESIKNVNTAIDNEIYYYNNEYIDYETVCDFLEDNKIDIANYIEK